MGTCVHFSRSLPSNSWWQTMAGWQALSRPSAAEGGGRRPAFTGLATQPYSGTEVDRWQQLRRGAQNRAVVHIGAEPGILDGGPERLSDAQDRIAVPLHHTPEADALSLPAADM